ncbi:carboxypeptidase regulatory-like domain-containing protein [Nostoc sp. UHCC 0702]|nr:carboxypeptidase regulatory-like domain-containing protein [Nostoc sp. UHCC 0702]
MPNPPLPPTPPAIINNLPSEKIAEKHSAVKTLVSTEVPNFSLSNSWDKNNISGIKPESIDIDLAERTSTNTEGQNFSLSTSLNKDNITDIKVENLNIDLNANTQNTSEAATPIIAEKLPDNFDSANPPSKGESKSNSNEAKKTPNSGNDSGSLNNLTEFAKTDSEPFLAGIIINGIEVGTLDIIKDGNTYLIPLDAFAELAKITVQNSEGITKIKTPLGITQLEPDSLRNIKGITYISDALIKEKLAASVEFNSSDLALIVRLPWREGSGQSQTDLAELEPEVRPPLSGLSTLRQELNIVNSSGDTTFRSSTLLGGRLLGGSWRARLNNNFVNQPDISEYFFFKRSGRLSYQIGRQQIGLHPLLNGMTLTGGQIAYTNLPPDRFYQRDTGTEILPRRAQPIQTFSGQAPPASFVQLRIGGTVVAQQQVGLNGQYEFIDVNLPFGQSNEIELLIYDRNNLNTPIEIRSLRLSASDLLLPANGNVQLAGFGISGNLAQDTLFNNLDSTESGQPIAFYQLRQGLSNNLTFEGTVQTIPDTVQAQAGLVWRLANPVIVASSVGTSYGKLGYTTDLDINLEKLEISGTSQLFPTGYTSNNQSRDRFNHSLELKYKFAKNFDLGFLARSRQEESTSASYILPTFALQPFSSLSLRGRPDIDGDYLFSAYYQPNAFNRLAFNTYGDVYSADYSYNVNRNYQLSFGSEFGGTLAPRYTATINHNASNLKNLSWKVGLAYSDGEVGPVVGASMQVLPGLLARAEYQAIPSRSGSALGGFGDDRLSVLLVSDLSFAGGRIAPANSSSLGQDRGAIAGRIVVEGLNKDFDLGGANIRVMDSRNNRVSAARTDGNGNFFVGGLKEGIYMVEIDPENLAVELTTIKPSIIAEVAGAAITRLDFPVRPEYGLAGRITDALGKPIPQTRVELINPAGARVLSSVTDQFGLYRLDGVAAGNYTLRVPNQDGIINSETLPKLEVAISKEFVYDQNLQLPITAAAKETKDK